MSRVLACGSMLLIACAVSGSADPDESTAESAVTVAANVDLGRLAGNQLVTSVAIDPSNPSHLLVGAHEPATAYTPAMNELFETRTGGAPWTHTLVSATPAQVAFDDRGVAYALVGSSLSLEPPYGAWQSAGITGQAFAIDRSHHVIAAVNVTSAGTVVSMAVLGGGSWVGPVSTSYVHATTSAGLASLAFDGDGRLYVAWIDPQQQAVMVQPPYTTFAPTMVAKLRAPATTPVALDVDRSTGPHRGTIYLSWADRGDDYDVVLATSSDRAVTFSAARRVNDDATGTVHDQTAPRLAVDDSDGSLNLVWNDTRLDAANRVATVFYARSTDGGATTPNTQVEAQGASQAAPQIAARGGVAWPVWSDSRSGDADVYASRIVGGPDFELAPASAVVASAAGLASYPIATAAMYGFSGPVTFAVANAPAGVRCVWDATTVATGGTATLYAWPGALAPGLYTIVVSATSGATHHLLSLGLQIPDFSVAPQGSDDPLWIVRTADGSVVPAVAAIEIDPTIGFDSSVAIAPVSLPPGMSATVSQDEITMSADATASRGHHTVTFSATGGGVVHTFTRDVQVFDDLIVSAPAAWSTRAADVSDGVEELDGGGMVAQFVAIPSDVASATLSFDVGVAAGYTLSVAVDTGAQTITVDAVQAYPGFSSQYDEVDLSRWRGQTVMLELVVSGSTTTRIASVWNARLLVTD